MRLTTENLITLSELAIEAAQKAGALIREYSTKEVVVKNKEAADSLASQVVTEVDVKAQNAILEVLSPSISEFDLALLTEESTDDKSRFEKDYFWCIDPMDGTLAFTEKTPGYAVSIALVSKSGEPVIGVVFDPTTQNLYHAVKGQGAFKNHKSWQSDLELKGKRTFTLQMDRTFLKYEHFDEFISELEEKLQELSINELQLQKRAGAVLNAIWTLEQAPGCYFKLSKPTPGGGSLWDFSATACIFNELGAPASSFDGTPLDLNRSDSSFMNHRGVLYASNQLVADFIKKAPSLLKRS
ncbi:inositol monophosphatase family protein [Draconibacterium sp. IB214405]|uniref:3'(2'),5'-bisphosphate nucleotidase CysQ family protein n=1 Tax=Draconibacterium sp. IB214405 TaxID=3097352 RepID=UPI002A11A65B|nr:inositol monophosphatase family protein [Draconibacterium sp. IB214405]MDX8340411.1 inositol monophosphatase family protein [Draconibacterium sp. IB214405]